MLPLILDEPAFLLTKITGTSLIGKPSFQAVYFISIWNP